MGHKNPQGYGVFPPPAGGAFSKYAHRRAYQELVGEIPDERVLDHLCRVVACVNPAHLEPVEHHENVRRGLHGVLNPRGLVRSHCPRGHPYDERNAHQSTDGKVRCRACNNEASRRYREKRNRR